MAVYVDNAFIQADVLSIYSSRWCHMTADTTEELKAFAKKIGLRASWIQNEGTNIEHFDLTEGKRRQAVKAGALEITWRETAIQLSCRAHGVPFDLSRIRELHETP